MRRPRGRCCRCTRPSALLAGRCRRGNRRPPARGPRSPGPASAPGPRSSTPRPRRHRRHGRIASPRSARLGCCRWHPERRGPGCSNRPGRRGLAGSAGRFGGRSGLRRAVPLDRRRLDTCTPALRRRSSDRPDRLGRRRPAGWSRRAGRRRLAAHEAASRVFFRCGPPERLPFPVPENAAGIAHLNGSAKRLVSIIPPNADCLRLTPIRHDIPLYAQVARLIPSAGVWGSGPVELRQQAPARSETPLSVRALAGSRSIMPWVTAP